MCLCSGSLVIMCINTNKKIFGFLKKYFSKPTEFHEPCVLPDGIIDDPISPIKVKITPASGESDRSDGQIDVTNSTKDVSSDDFLRQEVFSGSSNIASESSQISQDIEDRYDSTGQSETHATMEGSYDEQKEQDHHSTDGSDSLLKPGDMDTQYISDEDLIEHGDFVRGKVTNTDDRDHSKTDLPEQSHSSITVEGSSDDEEDAVVHSVEMREEFGEELDDYIDDSVDEFLASEKLEADDVKEADKESNTEHELDSKEKLHSSCSKDMQVIQDLSGQNPEDQQLHSIIPSLEGSENVPMTNPDEETIGFPGNEYESEQSENDLNMSVNEPTSGVDAKLQICQESVHTDQHDDCSINGEIQEQPSIPEWHGQCLTTDEHQHNMDEVSGQSTASDENLQECVTVEGNGECATNDEESSPEECKNAGPSSASDPDFMSGQESFHTERHGVCVTNDSDTSNIDEVKEPPSACETYLQSDQGIVDNDEPSDDITKDDEESNSTDQVKDQSSFSDADFQCGQESVGNDAPSDDIANDEAHSDDECKNEELAAQSSASDADFQSGQESVGNEEPDDDIHVDDTISDDDGNVFECTSDLPEVSAKEADLDEPIGDQGNDLDEDYTNAVGGESSEDKQVKEKEEKHLDIIEDEKKRDIGNVNTTEGEEGMTPDEAEYPDDKDEKCKIS